MCVPAPPPGSPHPRSVSPLSAVMTYENVGGVGGGGGFVATRATNGTAAGPPEVKQGGKKDTVLKPQVAFLGISPPTTTGKHPHEWD